ncbi:RSP_7527 family protein [Parasedimentitalea maritima]|nr:hypothetical protein [Zongyanglinia marina]
MADVLWDKSAYLMRKTTKRLMTQRVDTMNKIEYPQISAADIRNIEARAHQLRAEAMRDLFRALGRAIAALPRKISGLFHRPHHA